jgi:large subunit ribosomal protein L22
MKRIRPAPQGRAYRYQRRISHIELVLAERGKNSELSTVVGSEAAAPALRAYAAAARVRCRGASRRASPCGRTAARRRRSAQSRPCPHRRGLRPRRTRP